ncbi:DEAD/DEAH box helicase [Candidatus Woesearchaeota archaeon]|nr:DEAD/DEAH box helicase [Candidatus Woesearchaeota archaeon]
MRLKDLDIPKELKEILSNIDELRPAQEKSINAGLLKGKNLLVCTPTASGKTLVAELAAMSSIMNRIGKAVYIVPLKALATEKHKDFIKKYRAHANIGISIGDLDKKEDYLQKYDFIIVTAEKLDSLIRHNVSWLKDISTIIIDEIHLLNDPGRGPTLEILITMLRQLLPRAQIIALSATIGNPSELAEWLDADLVLDNWRPVELKKGIYFKEKIEFFE